MGGWLCARLKADGARLWGFSLPPPTEPSLFRLAALEQDFEASTLGDIRDAAALQDALRQSGAEIVFHLAAQPLVRRSFREPRETFATNVIGTAALIEAVRQAPHARAAIVVTSDKCYAEDGGARPHAEGDALGGTSPYASSKACAELVTTGFRISLGATRAGAPIATVRAGNVIGGGDWAEDRLVPDLVRAAQQKSTAVLRQPAAIRPWQHVLDPLEGYLALAERLWEDSAYAGAWNLGPDESQVTDVQAIARKFSLAWGVALDIRPDTSVPETAALRIDASKARARLGWRSRLAIAEAIDWTAQWYADWLRGGNARALTFAQVGRYRALAGAPG